MIRDYIQAALCSAYYKIIEEGTLYYGVIPELKGVWASGKTMGECQNNLSDTIEGWLLARNSEGMSIPVINGCHLIMPKIVRVA